MHIRRLVLPLVVLLHASSLAAEEVAVKIENFTFAPRVLTITAGTEVRWENHDDSPHSIVDSAAGIHSRALDTDETYERIFATPGTFDYICGLHPQMRGRIVVLP